MSLSALSSLPVAVLAESFRSMLAATHCGGVGIEARLIGVGLFPILRIAGSSRGFICGTGAEIGAGVSGGAAFSFAASTNSTISNAFILNSGRYLPFAGQVTKV